MARPHSQSHCRRRPDLTPPVPGSRQTLLYHSKNPLTQCITVLPCHHNHLHPRMMPHRIQKRQPLITHNTQNRNRTIKNRKHRLLKQPRRTLHPPKLIHQNKPAGTLRKQRHPARNKHLLPHLWPPPRNPSGKTRRRTTIRQRPRRRNQKHIRLPAIPKNRNRPKPGHRNTQTGHNRRNNRTLPDLNLPRQKKMKRNTRHTNTCTAVALNVTVTSSPTANCNRSILCRVTAAASVIPISTYTY